MGVFQMRMAMAWQRVETVEEVKPWFIRDSPGFQLIPELSPRPTEAIFDKITMSAFEGTPLNIVLRDCGVNVFAIVGVAMEVGIEPTVRHAADFLVRRLPGFDLRLLRTTAARTRSLNAVSLIRSSNLPLTQS